MSAPDRRAKLDRDHSLLSVRRQCGMLGIARSGVYRLPRPANDDDSALLRRIDELFTRWPFLGSRRMTAMLRAEGRTINRKRVQRLMRRMGIVALGPKPRTTKPAPGHTIFPYLLRDMTVERSNQVWAADITYIPIGRGFLSRGGDGLVEPGGAVVASVEHHGRLVLRLGAGGGIGPVRQA
jgi:putative transposase